MCRVVHREVRQASDDLHKSVFEDTDPDSRIFWSRISFRAVLRIRDVYPGSRIFSIPDLESKRFPNPSRTPGSKRHRIPDPQHWSIPGPDIFVSWSKSVMVFSISKTENVAFLSSKPACTEHIIYIFSAKCRRLYLIRSTVH